MAKKLFCPKCGSQASEGDLFCSECGNRIDIRKSQESVAPTADVETKQECAQFNVHVQSEPEKNEETVIQRGEAFYYKSQFGFGRIGTLLLTDMRLTFTAMTAKTDLDMVISLKDVEKVKLVANQNFSWHMIGVYLKDKQYLFNVKKKENWIEKINNAVNTVRNGKSEPTVKQNTDYIDEIKRLKELADAGVITKAEFEAKKKKLLDL